MNKTPKFSALVLLIIAIISCKEKPTPPVLTTTDISKITTTSAVSGGYISNDGGASIISKGICWNISDNPIITNDTTIETGESESFTSNLTQLTPNTLYFVRAYAINNAGISYGQSKSFSTLGQIPFVISQTPTNLQYTSATLNGSVNPNYLSSTVVFEWGTTTNYGKSITADQSPIIGNNIVNVSANISELTRNTCYHFRIVVTNEVGTSYSDDSTLTTLTPVIDFDGNSYDIKKIGNQIWMVENLKVTHYRNGDSIYYPGTDNNKWQLNTTGAFSWYDNDELYNRNSYGALYNWFAVNNSAGLCPTGWHVPSNTEWSTLINTLDLNSNPNNFPESQIAGGKLKSTITDPEPHPRWDSPNTGATNESGFSGLPAGYRRDYGPYSQIGADAQWWSKNDYYSSSSAWYIILINYSALVARNYLSKQSGNSVRCLKD